MTHRAPILVVDDEPHNLAAMRQILGDQHRLLFARSGHEALAATERCHPALILLDIQMPDLDGYSVCQRLARDPATESIPVIFVTGKSEVGNEEEGFAAGAVDYIVKPLSPAIVRARVKNHLSLVKSSMLNQSYRDGVSMLGIAGHYNDVETGVHVWRMSQYANALAAACGWAPVDCERLEHAASMHDTGKIGIPGNILRKPVKLTAEEWTIMQSHTRIGHKILAQSRAPVFRLAAEVALRHHERWDGSGYPDGLVGTAIPESARIVAVADVFDALTMRRPYKEAWPVEQALEKVYAKSGGHFEPRIVERFEAILPQILDIKAAWDAKEHHHVKQPQASLFH
ncbi:MULTISPECIES: response regulator [Thiorhodovibrio]|uniref:response regulator n=1 Tax=Thiorhodovibrio TaxID=61593 RepID=UPI001914033F|nr:MULTISPECIES: HD domain-containing phosphohydrolase [Thiorhodovibrio]MBK5969157.1 two-component system response regulator [Thiorhodovibrio winogradskyi]WPL13371.1 Cyclic di-GMP phosphodiesterase response regulator RpfG [Thiorhodovibrio litoralis]